MKIEAFLNQSPLFAVHWAARRFDLHIARLLNDRNLNFLEALILVSVLFEEPKRVSPSQLATLFSTTRGNISHCLSSLEAKSFLGRRIDANDARSYQLFLRPLGRKAAVQVIRTFDHMQTNFEKTVGLSQLTSALGVIRRVEEECSRMEI